MVKITSGTFLKKKSKRTALKLYHGVDVVVNAATLSETDLAQIVDIVKRKTGVSDYEIVISTVNMD